MAERDEILDAMYDIAADCSCVPCPACGGDTSSGEAILNTMRCGPCNGIGVLGGQLCGPCSVAAAIAFGYLEDHGWPT